MGAHPESAPSEVKHQQSMRGDFGGPDVVARRGLAPSEVKRDRGYFSRLDAGAHRGSVPSEVKHEQGTSIAWMQGLTGDRRRQR